MPSATSNINWNGEIPDSPFRWWLTPGISSGISTDASTGISTGKIPAEVEVGNVEYKWRLVRSSGCLDEERLVHLVTQMRWRVAETGHCWYILG